MRRAACKDWAEASCLISNLLAELEQPCRICREDSLVLTGRSPTGWDRTWCWRQRAATSCWMQHESEGAPMADRQTDDFKLGNKAADMWLYTADACANEKVIPKKYRYTTGTALMNGAEAICSCIEGANLIDLRERPAERLAMQREALCACKKLERKILRMAESKQYPGVSGQKAATWSKAVMTVRYMCAAWYEKDRSRAAQAREDVRRR